MTFIDPNPPPPLLSWHDERYLPGGAAQRGVASGRGSQSDSPDPAPLVYNSFSGADLQCLMYMETPSWPERRMTGDTGHDTNSRIANWKLFAELQTLTISSTRNVFPVRRLGESHSHAYTRGARTIAGTMIFGMLNRDVMAEFYRRWSGEVQEDAPFFVDQIPPFSIFIHGANEYGGVTNAALIDVTLVNYGQTLSVDDIYLESTYSYVARHFFPFVEDTAAFLRRRTALLSTRTGAMSMRWNLPSLYDRGTDEATRRIMDAISEAYPGFARRVARRNVPGSAEGGERSPGRFLQDR